VVVRTTPTDIGDEEPPSDAWLGYPSEIAVDAAGNLIVADSDRDRIMKVDPSGVVTTVAGGGVVALPDSDGGAATEAALVRPRSVAVDSTGAVYFVQTLSESDDDRYHPVVRRVAPDGTISTVAGGGKVAIGQSEGRAATEVQISSIQSLAVDDRGTPVAPELSDRVIAITLEQLREVPEVVAVAGGAGKERAIRSVLRAGVVTSLVTDEGTAGALLAADGD
jgi:hypothetical protein